MSYFKVNFKLDQKVDLLFYCELVWLMHALRCTIVLHLHMFFHLLCPTKFIMHKVSTQDFF